MKPIFGEPVPLSPSAELPTLAICPACGRDPVIVAMDGLTSVMCEHCDVWTVGCADCEEAFALWNEKPVTP